MRTEETSRLLAAVRKAVTEARAGGVTARACVFDATVSAVDCERFGWPSSQARTAAEAACRGLEPTTAAAVVVATDQPAPPLVARLLLRAGQWIAERSAK
jgi:hypothetical protein